VGLGKFAPFFGFDLFRPELVCPYRSDANQQNDKQNQGDDDGEANESGVVHGLLVEVGKKGRPTLQRSRRASPFFRTGKR
jgi:hypothetical protein